MGVAGGEVGGTHRTKPWEVAMHDHTSDVFPWPNDMTFSLSEFIAVVESRMKVAHETLTSQPQDTVGTCRTFDPGL